MAVKYIPLGIFFIVFNSSPFITVILSYFWTGDRILPLEGVAMLGAFAGIVCLGVAKPEEEQDAAVTSDTGNQTESSMSDFEKQYAYQIGMAMAVFSCLAQSVISVASRRLKSLHFAVIQFWYGLMASVVMAVFLVTACTVTSHTPYVYSSGWVYLEILVSSFLNMIGQNLMTYSNQRANPATVGLISYMGVMYNFAVDLAIFHESFTKL